MTQYWLTRFGEEEIKRGGGLKLSPAFLPPTSSLAAYSSPLPAIPLHGMENFADVTNYFLKEKRQRRAMGAATFPCWCVWRTIHSRLRAKVLGSPGLGCIPPACWHTTAFKVIVRCVWVGWAATFDTRAVPRLRIFGQFFFSH